jgi:hypothetical protein
MGFWAIFYTNICIVQTFTKPQMIGSDQTKDGMVDEHTRIAKPNSKAHMHGGFLRINGGYKKRLENN